MVPLLKRVLDISVTRGAEKGTGKKRSKLSKVIPNQIHFRGTARSHCMSYFSALGQFQGSIIALTLTQLLDWEKSLTAPHLNFLM